MEAWSLPPHCTARQNAVAFFLAELMCASKEASRGTGTDQLRGKEANQKNARKYYDCAHNQKEWLSIKIPDKLNILKSGVLRS